MTGSPDEVEQSVPPLSYRTVGPAGTYASDRSFAIALLTLWHKASEAGGALGFVPPVRRDEVAPVVAELVEDLRAGRARAVVCLRGRVLVGFAALHPGQRLTRHTGHISRVMVDPDLTGRGIGHTLMARLIEMAAELGLERLDLTTRDGRGMERFYEPLGFRETGRRPGWIRVAPGDDRDEVFWVLTLDKAAGVVS